MKQIDFIKQTYAGMSDEALIQLALSHGAEFHAASITALCHEFQKRRLNTTHIAALRTEKINYHIDKATKKENEDFEQFSNQVWQLLIEIRRDGYTRLEMYQELRKLELSYESCLWFLDYFDSYLVWMKKHYQDEKFAGGFLTLGCLVTITFLAANQLYNMALVISAAFGITNLIRYTTSKDRLDRLNKMMPLIYEN